jgi:SAM-dependent methyltransferase
VSQLGYYEYMGFRSEELLDRYVPYVEKFEPGTRVLDLGCGRGEFLQLLQKRGIEGLGVDADPEMVGAVKAKGLDAVVSDVRDYLRDHPGEFDGIFAAHLIEHMGSEQLVEFAKHCAEALRPGGRLILVTPNPHNLSVHFYEFWRDLQHVRFYTPEIVRWVVHSAGLREIEEGENPRYRSDPRAANHGYNVLHPLPPPVRLRSKLKQRLVVWLLPVWVSEMREVIQSFYPPAEFYVTGIR